MKINFLTTGISDKSGGAAYDKTFYEMLKISYSDITLYDDEYFKQICKKDNISLFEFNKLYKYMINELFDCDYLIMNSRIYTRFVMINIKKVRFYYKSVKVIVIHHHNNYMNNVRLKKIIHKYYELALLKMATELIIPNQYIIDSLSKIKGITSIKFLPSSFEKIEYPKSTLNNKKLLFVGTVEPRKGIEYGLLAFNILHKVHNEYEFIIAGRTDADIKYYKRLVKYVEANNLSESVCFEGRVTNDRLQVLYEKSDIFLFPSMLEGYGLVIIEAMGRGVPVIAFDNSAMPYTVKNGYNGRLIPNKDWKRMGKTLIEVLENSDTMKALQKGAIETYWSASSKDDLKRMTFEYIQSWD